jgi:hypothetical protein
MMAMKYLQWNSVKLLNACFDYSTRTVRAGNHNLNPHARNTDTAMSLTITCSAGQFTDHPGMDQKFSCLAGDVCLTWHALVLMIHPRGKG